MKSFFIYFMCFLIALVVSVIIAKIAGAFDKPHQKKIVISDPITELETVTRPEPEPEIEPEYEPEENENSYRRVIIIPEYIINVEYEETEEEYLAPETEAIKEPFYEAFTTYIYNGERKKLPASENLQKIVYKMAEKYGLPYRTVLALLGVETTWNEDPDHVEVHSGVRYIGIGCICEKYHAKNLASKGIDIYTLEGNVEGICWLLKAQYDRFGTIELAIMAYNGGAGYAQSQIKKGVTENSYTKRVDSYAKSFK